MTVTAASIVVPAMNVLLLIAVGLDLTPQDFTRVRQQRTLLAIGLLVPVLGLPVSAYIYGSAIIVLAAISLVAAGLARR